MVNYKEIIANIHNEYKQLEDHNDFTNLEKTIDLDYDNLDKVLFIKTLLSQNFDVNFVSTIFFYFPKLWSSFTLEDWKNIVNTTERPYVRPYMDSHGCFYDLFFLNKFLHVNPFALLENSEKNRTLITKMLAFSHLFVLNEFDIENLEDGTIPIAGILEETFKKLNVTKELISEHKDYDTFENYLTELAAQSNGNHT